MSSADTPAARLPAAWVTAQALRNDGVGSTPSEAKEAALRVFTGGEFSTGGMENFDPALTDAPTTYPPLETASALCFQNISRLNGLACMCLCQRFTCSLATARA
jgi:hypothetical protein